MIPELPREYSGDFSPTSNTVEANLLRNLLDHTHTPIHVLKGMGGTGKTTTLIALARHPQIQAKFHHQWFISLGQSADANILLSHLTELLHTVQGPDTAHRMLRLCAIRNNQQSAIAFAVNQLKQHSVLLLLDDIWVASDTSFNSQASVFDLIRQLVLGVDAAAAHLRVVLSSREDDVALILPSTTVIESSHLQAQSISAKNLICAYAGFSLHDDIEKAEPAERYAFRSILEHCDGLQLALAVAGKNVRERVAYQYVAPDKAWQLFLDDLRDSSLLLRDFSPTQRSASVMTVVKSSLKTVESHVARWGAGRPEALDVEHSFVSLGVMRKQRLIPWACLELLWNCDSSMVTRFAQALARVNLISVEREQGIRLHPRIHDYCTEKTEYKGYFDALHSRFLSRLYAHVRDLSLLDPEALRIRDVREWWSFSETNRVLHNYILHNVLWHLLQAKLFTEGLSLLCDFRWTQTRVNSNSNPSKVSGVEEDIDLFLGARDVNWPQNVQSGLRSMFEAVRLSSHYVSSNPRELAFQIHGRLAHEASSNEIVATFIGSLKAHAELPWLCASHGVLQPVSDTVTGKASLDVPLECAAVIPNSSDIIVGGSNGFLVIFNLSSAIIRRTLQGHERLVRDVKVSTQNGVFYTVSSDMTIRMWNLETGVQQSQLDCGNSPSCCELTPDGKHLVVGWKDGYLSILDAHDLVERKRWKGHDDTVRCILVDARKEMIFSAGSDGFVKKWHFNDEACVDVLLDDSENKHKARDMSFNSDQTEMAIAIGFSVFVINVSTGEVLRSRTFENWKVLYVQFAADQRGVYLAMEDGTTRLLHVDGTVETLARSHSSRLTRILLSQDSKMVISISADRTISTLKCDRSQRNQSTDAPEMNRLANLAVFPRQKRVLFAWEYGPRGLWKMDFDEPINASSIMDWGIWRSIKLVGGTPPTHIQDGKRPSSARNKQNVEDQKVGDEFPVTVVACEGQRATWVTVSPDEKYVAVGTTDGRITLYNPLDWSQTLGEFQVRGKITCITFSPDSRLLAACSTSSLVALWNLDDDVEVELESQMDAEDRLWVLAFNVESTGLVAIADREPNRYADVHFWTNLCTSSTEYRKRAFRDVVGLTYISIGVGLHMTEKYFAIQSDRSNSLNAYDFASDRRMSEDEEERLSMNLVKAHNRVRRPGRLSLTPFCSDIKYVTTSGDMIKIGTLESNPCHSFYPDQWMYDESSRQLVAGGKLRKLIRATVIETRAGSAELPALPSLDDYNATTLVGKEIDSDEYKVFISHAGPDKNDIAVPLYLKLRDRNVLSFVDIVGIHPGENAPEKMTRAMETAMVGVFILSPEFVARRWPMKELMRFLERIEEAKRRGKRGPMVIPVFYRLTLNETRDPNLYRMQTDSGHSVFDREGFNEPCRQREMRWDDVHEALKKLVVHRGVENKERARNRPAGGEEGHEKWRREVLLDTITEFALQAASKGEAGAQGNASRWMCTVA